MKPILVEIAACQGGATQGYRDAGWDVIATDIKDFSDRNPAEEFYVMDGLTAIQTFGRIATAFHASWPCQKYTHGNAANDTSDLPNLITPGRAALQATGKPYVIENVPRAPLIDPVTLCGSMFNLTTTDDDGTELHMQRHRLFETNWTLTTPEHVHPKGVQWAGGYGGARRDKREAREIRKGGYVPPKPVLERLMGIDWMTEWGLFQSLPPVYTEWIGRQLMELTV